MKSFSLYLALALLLAFAPKVTVCSAEQPATGKDAAQEKLDASFWEAMQAELKKGDVGIADDCEKEVKAFIHEGTSKLLQESPGKRLKAKLRLEVLAREVIHTANDEKEKMLSKATFERVKSIFCPGFWPFCE